jgi:hypothetical protein
VIPQNCPFCKQPAAFRSPDRDELDMDCPNCLIAVTFTGTAAATECQNPGRTLAYIREEMIRGASRPVVTSVDMRR